MPTYAIVTVDGGGNVPPALAIAAELTRRGHAVHVLGHERQRELVAAAGYAFAPLETLAYWNLTVRRSVPSAVGLGARLASDRGLEDEVRERVREIGADAALVDCIMPSSVRGARRPACPPRCCSTRSSSTGCAGIGGGRSACSPGCAARAY